MVDAIFGEPRLAEVYDAVDDDRRDLDAYVDLVDELGARSVLDIGCGTGNFACRLARQGVEVTGVDPAVASLAVARRKPGARRVTWVELTDVDLPFVSFQQTFVFEEERSVLTSESTLRFRDRSEISESLTAAGFAILDVRDAPDRPGLEFVFVVSPVDGAS